MITDSPYQVEKETLTPAEGIIAGLVAGAMMAAFVFIIQSISGILLRDLFLNLGAFVLVQIEASEKVLLSLGITVHFLFAGLLGLLYAACQQRIPVSGLIIVGIFYGFFIWILEGIFVSHLFPETLRQLVRSWPWLIACLLYGSSLAVYTIISMIRHPTKAELEFPKD